MLLQRLFLGAWLLLALVMIGVGLDYQAPFSYEPVGPRSFPLLMLGLLCAGLLYLLINPTPIHRDEHEPELDQHGLRKVVLCIALLLAFALLFEPLGFIPASTLVGACLARLYEGQWRPSLVAGLGLALGLYLLFDKLLDVPLPLGILSVLGG